MRSLGHLSFWVTGHRTKQLSVVISDPLRILPFCSAVTTCAVCCFWWMLFPLLLGCTTCASGSPVSHTLPSHSAWPLMHVVWLYVDESAGISNTHQHILSRICPSKAFLYKPFSNFLVSGPVYIFKNYQWPQGDIFLSHVTVFNILEIKTEKLSEHKNCKHTSY